MELLNYLWLSVGKPTTRIELVTPSLPRKCSTTELRGHIPVSTAVVRGHCWSGRRDSNPRPIAWKAITLPTELLPLSTVCEKFESVRIPEPERSDCPLASGSGQVSFLASQESGGWKTAVPAPRYLVWRGQDSNLRSPEGRRVYSPLPLSTRPPLLTSIGEFPISFPLPFRSCLCTPPSWNAAELPGRIREVPHYTHLGGRIQTQNGTNSGRRSRRPGRAGRRRRAGEGNRTPNLLITNQLLYP